MSNCLKEDRKEFFKNGIKLGIYMAGSMFFIFSLFTLKWSGGDKFAGPILEATTRDWVIALVFGLSGIIVTYFWSFPWSIFERRIRSIALRDVELLEFDEELARLENHILILEQKLADLEK